MLITLFCLFCIQISFVRYILSKFSVLFNRLIRGKILTICCDIYILFHNFFTHFVLFSPIFQAQSVEIKERKDDLSEIEDLGAQMEEQLILDNK